MAEVVCFFKIWRAFNVSDARLLILLPWESTQVAPDDTVVLTLKLVTKHHVYLKHLSAEYRSILSTDMWTNSRPICRPTVGTYVGRDATNILTDIHRQACRPMPGRYFIDSRPILG